MVVMALACVGIPAGAARSQGPGGQRPATSSTQAASAEAESRPAQQAPPKVHVAHVRLGGRILDGPPAFSLFGDSQEMTLRDWLKRLAEARKDDGIKAVALEIDSPGMSWAQAEELADAVARLNKVKPVYAYISGGGTGQYIIASAAGEVAMEPVGRLMIIGLGAEFMFFRGTLDKLGIQPQLIQVGRFKGAAEPMTNTGPSAELVSVYESLLDDLYDQLCGQIAAQRSANGEKLSVAEVGKAIDAGPLTVKAARRFRLVDHVVEKADWRSHVKDRCGAEGLAGKDVVWSDNYGRKSVATLDLSNPFAILGLLTKGLGKPEIRDPSVAIIHAQGLIVSGRSGEGIFGQKTAGAKTLIRCFNEVRRDDRVKAVVFRIDSPGGSALASELIYQAVRKCADEKPVIVSISSVGASGGYYIACGAPRILADASGIVGSIGVVSGKFAISGLLDKIGVTTYEMTRGRNAGLGMSRPWTEREQAVIRELTEQTYRAFVKRVSDARAEKVWFVGKKIEDLVEGRVFTARQAAANGLIDKVGGLRDAILEAQKAAGIEKSHFIVLPRPKTIMDILRGGAYEDAGETPAAIGAILPETAVLRRWTSKFAGVRYLLNIADLCGGGTVLAAMPYYVSIRR